MEAPTFMVSVSTRTCNQCGMVLSVGDKIFPSKTIVNNKRKWMHLDCAIAYFHNIGEPCRPPLCKHWVDTGHCMYRAKCFFSHPEALDQDPDVLIHRAALSAARAAPRRQVTRGVGYRNKVNTGLRLPLFRKWLVETYGMDHLTSGSGVLDVAGGKGELASELENLNAVRCSVLEPRCLWLYKTCRKLSCGLFHRNAFFGVHYERTANECASNILGPDHLRIALTPDLVQILSDLTNPCSHHPTEEAPMPNILPHRNHEPNCIHCRLRVMSTGHVHVQFKLCVSSSEGGWECDNCKLQWEKALQLVGKLQDEARTVKWTRRGLTNVHADEEFDYQAPAMLSETTEGDDNTEKARSEYSETMLYGHEISHAHDILIKIMNCSVIVGMHPDQATGSLVELAVALNKPFAVVPCCVFGKEFPGRRLKSGQQVSSYSDLLTWLREKDERIQVQQMLFGGKNVLLYRT